jgi:hypothetical protein
MAWVSILRCDIAEKTVYRLPAGKRPRRQDIGPLGTVHDGATPQ